LSHQNRLEHSTLTAAQPDGLDAFAIKSITRMVARQIFSAIVYLQRP
jgi:hypothetical protein